MPDNNVPTIFWFALVFFTSDELAVDQDCRDAYFKGLDINETLGWDTTAERVVSVADTSERIISPTLSYFII